MEWTDLIPEGESWNSYSTYILSTATVFGTLISAVRLGSYPIVGRIGANTLNPQGGYPCHLVSFSFSFSLKNREAHQLKNLHVGDCSRKKGKAPGKYKNVRLPLFSES